MATNQTTENDNSVTDFVNSIPYAQKRADTFSLVELYHQASGFEPKMWGPAIIGFGSYHYRYESGREGDAPLAGFSPRKNAITLYFEASFEGRDTLLARLGKFTTSKVCVYVKRLSDIDTNVLLQLIKASMKHTMERYPG